MVNTPPRIALDPRAREVLLGHLARARAEDRYVRIHVGRG